jgi:PAS domain S-box-containing protein
MSHSSSLEGSSHSSDHLTQQDLRVLLDHAPDAIGRFNRELRHVYVNEATARANGRPAQDFLGKSMADLGHAPEICALIDGGLREVFSSAQERRFEIHFESPQGTMWFHTRMVPEHGSSGAVEYVLVISRDITQQKLTEAALHEAETRAAASQITATLAHEINNPLAAVVNAIYLLGRNPSLDSDARELLNVASASLERITNISRRMLFLYKREDEAVG